MMKKILFTISALLMLSIGACTDMNNMVPEGGTLLDSQLKETTNAIPARADAVFTGMYTKLGEPISVFTNRARPDDFGFIMCDFSNDLEAADIVMTDNGYNWFSVCGELSSRNANYANPYIRYASAYNEIAAANDVMKAYPADNEDPDIQAKIGQAYAIRAYSYMRLAPYFQFRYATAADQPCVPIVTLETTEFANNPRATVKEVYDLIISDLTTAIEKMEGYKRPDKGKIDQQVAYGLRARAYLYMEKWAEALADAEKAAYGYEPATIKEVSKPAFYDINDHNWMWGYDMTTNIAGIFPYATSSAWIRSFSENGYSQATDNYSRINNILYDKISNTDVRKGWWLNENKESPLLDGLTWRGASGQEIVDLEIPDAKTPMPVYANVKFGCNPIGTVLNDEDWPFMRVEEMILIQAECYANMGNEGKAREVLNAFVRTYRDPSYNVASSPRTLSDEIWFQRRIELWGEGFSNADTRRLGKPLVRFTDPKTSIVPPAWRFNMTPDDGWWLLRFTDSELNTNLAIIDNTGGNLPVGDQNPNLRDGVTD